MSASFEVQSSTGRYSVHIRSGILDEVLQPSGARIFIADEYFAPLLQTKGVEAITIASSEAVKSLDAMPAIIAEMRRKGVNRQSEVVALGGGIVQDVSAFAASVFMRGIPWRYLPTTLLAMADSCIGGKSSINVGPYKNLVGTFHPPTEVLIDPSLTDSLSPAQRAAGLVEAAKICYCRGTREFDEYLALSPDPNHGGNWTEPILLASLLAKKWFIETDEFDNGVRLLLNFGHTFGHAIEGATHFRISHGAAVAVGVLCAIAFRSSTVVTAKVKHLEEHMRFLLSAVPEIGSELSTMPVDDVVERFQADKKHLAFQYTLILPSAAGGVELVRVERSPKTWNDLRTAISRVVSSFQQ